MEATAWVCVSVIPVPPVVPVKDGKQEHGDGGREKYGCCDSDNLTTSKSLARGRDPAAKRQDEIQAEERKHQSGKPGRPLRPQDAGADFRQA